MQTWCEFLHLDFRARNSTTVTALPYKPNYESKTLWDTSIYVKWTKACFKKLLLKTQYTPWKYFLCSYYGFHQVNNKVRKIVLDTLLKFELQLGHLKFKLKSINLLLSTTHRFGHFEYRIFVAVFFRLKQWKNQKKFSKFDMSKL